MGKEKLIDLQITELFLVKADWHRTFMATIIREKTEEGKDIIRGSVVINEGQAWSVGSNEDELGKNLDEICTMKLDMGLHSNAGEKIDIFGLSYHLN